MYHVTNVENLPHVSVPDLAPVPPPSGLYLLESPGEGTLPRLYPPIRAKVGPKLFNAVADIIAWVLCTNKGATSADDFLFLSPTHTGLSEQVLATAIIVLRTVHKTEGLFMILEFLYASSLTQVPPNFAFQQRIWFTFKHSVSN